MKNIDKFSFINFDKETKEEVKKLVTARLQTNSDDLHIAIGLTDYNKKELLEHVAKEDDVGKEIMEIQLEYLRDMAKGNIYQEQP